VKAVGNGRPVVLVGHSMGGPIVRQFAYRHPKLVAGIVLVDPSADHQPDRFSAIAPRYKVVDAASREPSRKCLAALEKGPIAMGTPEYGSCVGPAPPDMPAELRHFHLDYGQSPIHHRAMLAELDGAWSEASGREADAARKTVGDVPMIVLTAGKETLPPGFTPEETAQFNALWRRMHWEMLTISTDSRRRFVEGAGHTIWIDRPEAVIQAVDEVVAEARARVRSGARR
jgi:pimeloyl-ACP methyl ester carboxylesterase